MKDNVEAWCALARQHKFVGTSEELVLVQACVKTADYAIAVCPSGSQAQFTYKPAPHDGEDRLKLKEDGTHDYIFEQHKAKSPDAGTNGVPGSEIERLIMFGFAHLLQMNSLSSSDASS